MQSPQITAKTPQLLLGQHVVTDDSLPADEFDEFDYEPLDPAFAAKLPKDDAEAEELIKKHHLEEGADAYGDASTKVPSSGAPLLSYVDDGSFCDMNSVSQRSADSCQRRPGISDVLFAPPADSPRSAEPEPTDQPEQSPPPIQSRPHHSHSPRLFPGVHVLKDTTTAVTDSPKRAPTATIPEESPEDLVCEAEDVGDGAGGNGCGGPLPGDGGPPPADSVLLSQRTQAAAEPLFSTTSVEEGESMFNGAETVGDTTMTASTDVLSTGPHDDHEEDQPQWFAYFTWFGASTYLAEYITLVLPIYEVGRTSMSKKIASKDHALFAFHTNKCRTTSMAHSGESL